MHASTDSGQRREKIRSAAEHIPGIGCSCSFEQQNGSFTLAFALRRQTLSGFRMTPKGADDGGQVECPATGRHQRDGRMHDETGCAKPFPRSQPGCHSERRKRPAPSGRPRREESVLRRGHGAGKGRRCALEQQNGSFTLAFALRRQTLFRVQDDTRGAALSGEVLWPASLETVCIMI